MKVKLLDRKINEIEADFEVILVVDKNLNHEFIKKFTHIFNKFKYIS